MFKDLLNHKEALALVKAMAYFANVDGKITSEELQLLEAAAENVGIEIQAVLKEVSTINLEEILLPVQSSKSKRIFIQELITVGYADGHYFQLEKDAVREVASILGVDNKTVDRIDAWIQEGVNWAGNGYELVIEGK